MEYVNLIKGVRDKMEKEQIKELIDETWEERDKILKKLDTSKKFNEIKQAVARVEKNEFRSLLIKKLNLRRGR